MKTIKTKNNGIAYQIDIMDSKVTLQGKSGLAMGCLIYEIPEHYMLLVDNGVIAYSKSDWVKIS